MDRDKIVVTFNTTHAAIKAESLLKNKKDINFDIIPVPRHISSGCGIALLMENSDLDRIKQEEHLIFELFKEIHMASKI